MVSRPVLCVDTMIKSSLLLACILLLVSCEIDIRYHLGTKTPYWIQGDPANYAPTPDGCSISHINLVARHGSRAPTAGQIKTFLKLQQTLQKNLNNIQNLNIYPWIAKWKEPFPLEVKGLLLEQGEKEHYYLAKRLKEYFPTDFEEKYYSVVYPIQTTQIPRASRSGSAFGYGLWEGNGTVGPCNFEPFYIYSNSLSLDFTLRFFDTCPYYQSLLNSGVLDIESNTYAKMVLPSIAANLNEILGTYPNWNITLDEALSMYEACSLQASLLNVTDQWCSLFTDDQLLQLEYLDDLSTYYESGYGNFISYAIASPLLAEFVDIMEAKINGSLSEEMGKFRFAHAETILPFVSMLGLFKDSQPLLANSSDQFIQSRLWRDSVSSPYAANTKIILYNCTYSDGGTYFLVKLLHNEKEYVIPGCGDLYCPYENFKKIYSWALNLNWNSICYPSPEYAYFSK